MHFLGQYLLKREMGNPLVYVIVYVIQKTQSYLLFYYRKQILCNSYTN